MPQPTGPIGIVLQARDYALLQGLLDSRLMTLKHAAVLHFEGKIEAAKKRLQKLQTAGMVVQRARRPQDPAVYLLGREGYLSLKRAGLIDPRHDPGWAKIYKRQRIGDLMLAHELAVMDVKVSLVTAIAKRPDLELVEMSTSPDRHKFRVVEAVPVAGGGVRFRSLYVKPDGLLHVRAVDGQTPTDYRLYLEVDRGSESIPRLFEKCHRYAQRVRKRSNVWTRAGTEGSIRVAFIFTSASRKENVRRRLKARSRRLGMITLTTLDEVKSDPIRTIRCLGAN